MPGLEWGFRFDVSNMLSADSDAEQFEQRNSAEFIGEAKEELIHSFIHSLIHCLLIRLSRHWFPLLLERERSYDAHELERIVQDDLIQMHRKATLLPSPSEGRLGSS